MEENEDEPPFEANSEILEYLNANSAELDEEFGLTPGAPSSFVHWPKFSARVYQDALFWHMDRTRPLAQIGRFGAIKVIGEGGFGAVFKALDPELDRYVAIKLCPVRRAGTEEALKLEAKALARLKHPNIITVHDVGFGRFEDREAFFIVTEFIEAVSMRDYSPLPGGQHPRDELIDIFSSVGEALACAHEAGVVHGDIKPGNIIFDESTRRPYVIDFGLAHIVAPDVETIERNHGGTLPYMAPELLRGEPRTALTDQYAFCVSLWRCLDGRSPYQGRNTEELLADIEIGAPAAVLHDALIPEQLREVLRRGLREEAAQRFSDMRALLDALARVRGPRLVGEEGPELEPPDSEESGPKSGPNLAVVKGLVVGFALASSLSGLLALTGDEPSPSRSETKVDPIMEARREFARAQRALDAGQDWVAYKAWDDARQTLAAKHPQEVGRLTLELADRMAQVRPKQVTSAWMALSGAEAYEQAALAEGDEKKERQLWELAAGARERAADFFADAGDNIDATKQLECKKNNEAGQPCQVSAQQ